MNEPFDPANTSFALNLAIAILEEVVIVIFDDPSNDADPATAPDREIVLAVDNFVALATLPLTISVLVAAIFESVSVFV